MSGTMTLGGGEKFSTFPAHAQPAILRIWQKAHWFNIGGAFLCMIAKELSTETIT